MFNFFKIDHEFPSRWMTRRYLFALITIGMLAVAAFTTVGLLIDQYKNTLSIVNISGRQRMLSQRTALYVGLLQSAPTKELFDSYKQSLLQATDLLEESHKSLTGKNPTPMQNYNISPRLSFAYFYGSNSVDKQMKHYISALRSILELQMGKVALDHPSVVYVSNVAPNDLLDALDKMVNLYQAEGIDKFGALQSLEAIFLCFTLFILGIEARFIFKPMVTHVTRQVQCIQDFSEQLEHKVNRRTQELKDANTAKSKFLAAASHDLKQPLEAIGMFSGMLEKRMESDKSRAILSDMHQAQRSMRLLLDSILDISKLEAGVVVPKPTTFDIGPLLIQLTREYRLHAHNKGLELRHVPCHAIVHTDPLLLERILRNFLSNAVRYTKEGRILFGCRHVYRGIRIEVLDTGSGIDPEGMKQIFNEFAQLDDPERDRSEGIGLGLSIAKRLSILLKTPINCTSHVKKGSKFTVYLKTYKPKTST